MKPVSIREKYIKYKRYSPSVEYNCHYVQNGFNFYWHSSERTNSAEVIQSYQSNSADSVLILERGGIARSLPVRFYKQVRCILVDGFYGYDLGVCLGSNSFIKTPKHWHH